MQGQSTIEPNFRRPFDRISDPQIPLTRLKKWSHCRFLLFPNDYLINRAMSYGSESQQTKES